MTRVVTSGIKGKSMMLPSILKQFSGRSSGILSLMAAALVTLFMAGQVHAAASVSWLSPADGSSAPVGTNVAPTGIASGVGSSGDGLDLVLVLDSSGSMALTSAGQTRQQWQRDAAIALVNSLPAATTSVSIVEFDTNANVVTGLTSLTPASNITDIINAINGVDRSGGTNIASGIVAATSELTGANATTGRSKQVVVISDGDPTAGNQNQAAIDAIAAGVNNIHSVAIPGANVSAMEAIATNGNGVFSDFSNAADLANIVDVFNGTSGNLVGLDRVEVTLPDGTVITVPTDGLGNFNLADYALELGDNVFSATAFATDGTQATADLTVIGTAVTTPVPLPAAAWMLLAAIAGLGAMARRKHS